MAIVRRLRYDTRCRSQSVRVLRRKQNLVVDSGILYLDFVDFNDGRNKGEVLYGSKQYLHYINALE